MGRGLIFLISAVLVGIATALAAVGPWGSPGGPRDPTAFSYNLTGGREPVDCKASLAGKSAVVVTLGQSLMGNTGDPRGFFEPGPGVFNFNWIDKKCYVAKEPLLGTTKADANQTIRIGALLVSRNAYDSVVLVPLANGGTFIRQWAPGGEMHLRLIEGLHDAVAAGLTPTVLLWEQGEAEAGNPPQPPNEQAWIMHFRSMVASIRANDIEAPIYVAHSTICRNAGSPIIRATRPWKSRASPQLRVSCFRVCAKLEPVYRTFGAIVGAHVQKAATKH
jgi:hypothetical protein